jgi:branched-chain amino acid transport system substrate-binding protein
VSRIYASLPLSGPQSRLGSELLRGAELALERAGPVTELVVLDSAAEGAAANARRAARDAEALAYLGDARSSEVLLSAPILGAAGVLAVAPAATYAELRGPTLVRLLPHDGVGARAIAGWLVDHGVGTLLVLHDHDDGYGVPVGVMCADAARERGLTVRSRPVGEEGPEDLAGAEAALYVGVAGSGAVAMWRELHSLDPALWLLGSDGVAVEWLARELEPSAAERTRFFVSQRASWEFYGFEAMALILDALAAGDRDGVVALARGTRDRDSILGRYSVDPDGLTTMTACGRLGVADGQLVWDRG